MKRRGTKCSRENAVRGVINLEEKGQRKNDWSIANKKGNFMAKKTSASMGLYLVKPEVKPGVVWPSVPKDANPAESQYAYFARKYMAAQAARSPAGKKD